MSNDDFKFKAGDRVVDITTGHTGKVLNSVRGVDHNNYGVVLDEVGYVILVERSLKVEADLNSCDAMRIMDRVKYLENEDE
jgi:hypothetical protein